MGHRTLSDLVPQFHHHKTQHAEYPATGDATNDAAEGPAHKRKDMHVGFVDGAEEHEEIKPAQKPASLPNVDRSLLSPPHPADVPRAEQSGRPPKTPDLHNLNSPFYAGVEKADTDYFALHTDHPPPNTDPSDAEKGAASPSSPTLDQTHDPISPGVDAQKPQRYTTYLASQPPQRFLQTLRPFNGRLNHDNWFKVAVRPFILFAYPSVLWSTLVYSLSVGWLIVLSESVASIYRNKETYNFTALGTGLIYISPFIGGVLGTAVAGKVSDIIVRYLSRRNGGLYEPEFRLVMAVPIAITTTIGLMGFGWAAEERDKWIVPTVFFGLISFGCSLGSTTAITFCVDSYRQYAGEALVTLNFSKSTFLATIPFCLSAFGHYWNHY